MFVSLLFYTIITVLLISFGISYVVSRYYRVSNPEYRVSNIEHIEYIECRLSCINLFNGPLQAASYQLWFAKTALDMIRLSFYYNFSLIVFYLVFSCFLYHYCCFIIIPFFIIFHSLLLEFNFFLLVIFKKLVVAH